MSELFSIQLQNRQQQGRDGVWLDLPTTTEQVQAALRQIGISSDNLQGLFISGYFAEEEKRFAISYNMVLASNVDELNFLASRLETLSTGERAELNAALQAPQSELFSIGRITDFPENVDYYVHLPDVHGPAQTEGEPLPSIVVNELSGSVQDYQDFFKALEQSSPVPIGFEDIEGGAHGYFHLLDNRIAIQEGMSQLQTIKTAIHEIAHAKLHAIDPTDPEQTNRLDSRTREVQAESVAYAVCQHYGLDTSEYSFGYVAGWSSGRELAELKASLEIIRNAAHELISALDEHLAELRQQRETELSTAQEAAFALDNGNILFIQTCDSGYDYTLYDADKKALDGGQLDAPGLTLPDAGQEALNLLGQTAAVSEVLLGDKLAAFQDAAEKTNEIPEPVKIPDPAAEPTVTILWSESDKLQDGEIMPLSVANRVFEELDTAQHTDREKDGYTGGWYDKTAFRIDFTLNGQPDNYEGRQDFGDGEGSLVQHIQNYHEYYAKDENWKNFVLHNKGPEAWEQDKAEREMVLTEFIPYLKQHCNLSAMEQAATAALREGQNISPEQAAYYNTVVAYVQDCRPLLNQGQYNLPEPPKLADFDQSLQDYKAQVQTEIAQEAAAAGMTVEEYAAAGFEAPQPPCDLIDVDTNLLQFGGLRPDVGGVDVDNITVYQHLPGVCRKVPGMQQSHLLPDKFPFLRRHGNTQNNFSGSVRHSFTSFLGGLGYSPASISAGSGYTPYACYVTFPHYYDTTTPPFCPQNAKK